MAKSIARQARERRRLQKEGGTRLSAVTISDLATWTEYLQDEGCLSWDESSPDAIRQGTEKYIAVTCREIRREKADRALACIVTAKTGTLEREEPRDKSVSWRPSSAHWSFKTGRKRDKGHTYTPEELEAYLEDHTELLGDGAAAVEDGYVAAAGSDAGSDDAEDIMGDGGVEDAYSGFEDEAVDWGDND